MTVPLVILASLAVVAALLGIPFRAEARGSGVLETEMQNYLLTVFHTSHRLAEALETAVEHEQAGVPWSAYFTAWAAALTGGGLAVFLYRTFFPSRAGRPAPAFAQGLRSLAQNKFYVDELYETFIIRPIKALSVTLYKVVDGFLIDGVLVTGTARLTGWLGSMLRYFQTGDVQSYAAVMVIALFFGVGYALLTVLR
jgi:NADH-quinone oxidoreductase subunit L